MRIATKIQETRSYLRSARREGKSVGLVPTMGAFHDGHLALMQRARCDEDVVAVSLFVNPTQFGPGEDYDAYIRDFQGDARKAQQAGVDLLFAPEAAEMYPSEPVTTVHVSGLTEGLCGAHRPGHFDGVTTVCCKLFSIFQPDRAYFGEKDYQQIQVIRRMVADLNLPLTVVPVPTVREPDGLAMSSRNAYLTPEQRQVAPALYAALTQAAEGVRAGGSADQAEQHVRDALAAQPLFALQYVAAVHPHTLEPATHSGPPMVIAVAAHLGQTRLIDNIRVEE